MNKKSDHLLIEEMGLRLESPAAGSRFGRLVDLALLLSGLVWLWMAVTGPELMGWKVASFSARVGAGLIGVGTLSAYVSVRRRHSLP